jgi:hypothetical protein
MKCNQVRKAIRRKAYMVELRGLEPLTPTLPARVIGQISCWSVPPEIITSLYSLGFVPSRVAT